MLLEQLSLGVRALKVQGNEREQRSQADVQSFTVALDQANKSLAEEKEKNEALIGKLDSACSERAELMEKIRRMEVEFKAALAEKEEDLRATMDAMDRQKGELKAEFANEKLAYRDQLMAFAKGLMEEQYSKGCATQGTRICYYFPEAEDRHKQLYEARFAPFEPEGEEEEEEEEEAGPSTADVGEKGNADAGNEQYTDPTLSLIHI